MGAGVMASQQVGAWLTAAAAQWQHPPLSTAALSENNQRCVYENAGSIGVAGLVQAGSERWGGPAALQAFADREIESGCSCDSFKLRKRAEF